MLKNTPTLFSLSNHYIRSLEFRVIVHQVQTNYHDKHMVQKSVLIMRDPHYDQMRFKSVKALGALHS